MLESEVKQQKQQLKVENNKNSTNIFKNWNKVNNYFTYRNIEIRIII